ncbi:MAG: Ldh family oxidoreductase, partial [Chloroflexi bacterium]|nr:Ldh family oxidoreductase [Chloroflexota bacterium]
GKVGLTVAEGKPIPPGWILDREGRPTTDPAAARDALLVPIGEYKGYGLTMVMETLAAVLSGARFALQQDRAWSRDSTRPGERGHFFLAINPAMFMPIADFKARVDQMIADVHGSPLAVGASRIYAPGEIEWETYGRARERGITLPGSAYASIARYAEAAGLTEALR